MEITFAVLADAANASASGKLNILGVFDELNSRRFPARHPQLALVFRAEAGPGEFGQTKVIEVHISDEDGKPVGGARAEVSIPDHPGRLRFTSNHIIEFRDTVWPEPGTYQFSIMVDRDTKRDVSLRLVQWELPAAPDEEDG